MIRCSWVNLNNKNYVKYHDEEWCIPVYDDTKLFEMLILEIFESGLSWECILNKRDNIKEAFDYYNIDKIINYNNSKINELMNNKNIVRNKLKIKAIINNAKIYKDIQNQYGLFSNYIWSFTNNKTIYNNGNDLVEVVVKDLKKKGMKFIGKSVINSYLSAIGVIFSHEEDCYKYTNKTH